MRFDFGFYSSLLLIFFVHGLVYAILLYRKGFRNESAADKWLSLFLVLCILYIAPWMLGFAGWYDNQPYRDILFYTPFQQLFFIGPVIFFYIQSLLNPSFRFGKKEGLHLIPGLLYLLYSAVAVITDKLVMGEYYFLASGADPDFDRWYQVAGHLSMFIYLLLSLRYYQLYKKLMVQVVSYADRILFNWVRQFLYAFLVMLLIRVIFYLAELIPGYAAMRYMGPWWGYFSFAIVFYYIAITGYANSIEAKVPFKLNLLSFKPSLLLSPSVNTDDEISGIEEAEVIEISDVKTTGREDVPLVEQWKPTTIALLEEEKIWQDPELSLTHVAKRLATNPSFLSKIINQGFQLNFNDFINNYRINAVKEMLAKGEHKKQTLLGIAFDCGFNSKATFNRAFKKATGLSPKEWAQQTNG
jgi:AraC-like DNA-binding protein